MILQAGIPTSKKGEIPWNYIYWIKANESAMNMYKDNQYVSSDLVTERQWGYIADWLAESGYYDNISTYGVDDIGGLDISEGNDRQGFRVVLYFQ